MIFAACALAFASALFFHGYEIFNFTLSIDEEVNLWGEDALGYLKHARWGLALRTWLLLPDTTVPVTPIATGLALYGAAFVLLVRKFRIQHWGAVAVAAPLFFGFPVLIYAIAFASVALTLGIGTIAVVLALYVAEELRPAGLALAVALVAFATSLYQPFLFLAIVVFSADLIARIWPPEQFGQPERLRLIYYGGIIVSGLALYALIAYVLLKIFGLQLTYVTQFVQPESLEHGGLAATLVEAGKLYSGAAPSFLNRFAYYRILIAFCSALLLWRLVASGRTSRSLTLLIGSLIGVMLAAPFLQHPLSGGHLPYRSLIGLPAAIAILVLFASEMSPPRFRAFVLVPLAALVAIQFSWIGNRQYYAGHWSLERDKAIATQIISRIESLAPNQPAYTVAVVGALRRTHSRLIPKVPDSTLGASFFEWDGGNAARVAALLSFLSDIKFSPASPEQSLSAFEVARTMPSWPAPGSIAQADGVVVIKLSPPNRTQLAPYCQDRDTSICAEHRR